MSRPSFVLRVPSIPQRKHSKKHKRKGQSINRPSTTKKLLAEASHCSFQSSPSDSKLKVLETYDEYLNFKDIEHLIWTSSTEGHPAKTTVKQDIVLLKQIFANPKLDFINTDQKCQLISFVQTEHAKISKFDIQTAIIAQRIVDTQEQLQSSRTNAGRRTENKESTSSSYHTERLSLGLVKEDALSQNLSNLTSKYAFRTRKPFTCENEVQVTPQQIILNSADTQTEHIEIKNTVPAASKIVQTCRNAKPKLVQSIDIQHENKFVNTENLSYPNQERCTQMYEHITENDLFCMEWIDKNLFRVPVNPNTVIVDKKIKDVSEFTCRGTNFFEQELSWERKALCL